MRLRQVGLHHHARLARIGHVDGGEVLRRALVREPQDAAAVGRDLDRHAFAHAAEAVEQVMAEQLEIPGDRAAVALRCGLGRDRPARLLRRGLLCRRLLRRLLLGDDLLCGLLLRDFLPCDFHSTLHALKTGAALARFGGKGEMVLYAEACRPRESGDPYPRGRGMWHDGSPPHVGYSRHAHLKRRSRVNPRSEARGRHRVNSRGRRQYELKLRYALALAHSSGRSAFFQSGMAEIFFSRSSTSASFCRPGTRSDGKLGSTSTLASALAKVSRDME